MDTFEKICYGLVILAGLGVALTFMILFIDLTTEKVTSINYEGPCYDGQGALINNVTCTVETKCGIIQLNKQPEYCLTGVRRE